jgi:hypothetical protein
MGWFDYYQPRQRLTCPVCGSALHEWQGTEGPCALLVWREGLGAPNDQRVDVELRPVPWPNPTWRLPGMFSIFSYDCECPFPVEAFCRAIDGCWMSTDLVVLANAVQRSTETRAAWASRRRWLESIRSR